MWLPCWVFIYKMSPKYLNSYTSSSMIPLYDKLEWFDLISSVYVYEFGLENIILRMLERAV